MKRVNSCHKLFDKRLKVDVGTPKALEKEKIETLEKAKMNDYTKYIKLGDVSKNLGAKF